MGRDQIRLNCMKFGQSRLAQMSFAHLTIAYKSARLSLVYMNLAFIKVAQESLNDMSSAYHI